MDVLTRKFDCYITCSKIDMCRVFDIGLIAVLSATKKCQENLPLFFTTLTTKASAIILAIPQLLLALCLPLYNSEDLLSFLPLLTRPEIG